MNNAAHSFIILARHLASYHNYKRSYDMYRCAFDKQPELTQHYATEFHIIFTLMNEELDKVDNKIEIFANFHKAMQIYPEEVRLFNDLGQYLHKYGYYYESLCNFERAIKLDSSYTCIEDNLNKAKRLLFPKRYFRVLNDNIFIESLKDAIKKSVKPNTHVVIISGVGLTALYANECMPDSITMFVPTNIEAKIAENIVMHNKADTKIINNYIDLNLEINKAQTVIFTDFTGLFTDGMLELLCNIKEHFSGKIMPCKAEYYVAGIKSNELVDKYRLNEEAKRILNIDKNDHISCCKTYSTEDVMLFNDIEYVTEEKLLFQIDFNDYNNVYNILNTEELMVELLATKDGEIDAIIGWFNIDLTDDISVTNNPNSEYKSNAWPQAIYPNITPKELHKNDKYQILFSIQNGSISSVEYIKSISPECMTFLNDTLYIDMIVESVKTACVYLGQSYSLSELDIIDLNPFPAFGILMLVRGANSLTCLIKEHDEEFLDAILKSNQIELDRVTILDNITEVLDKNFHVIFHNIIKLDGDIDFEMRAAVCYLKQECLVDNGLCLPEVVTLVGQLISSKSLELENKIDQSTDYNVSKYVNRYQTSKVVNIDIARLEFEPLSSVFKVDICNDFMESGVVNTTVNVDGECNGILCWYEVQIMNDWKEVCSNRSNSFVNSSVYVFDRKIVFCGDEANVLKCVDTDTSFKLVLDVEL